MSGRGRRPRAGTRARTSRGDERGRSPAPSGGSKGGERPPGRVEGPLVRITKTIGKGELKKKT